MKQKIILLLLALCFSLPSMAQHRHEISIAGGFGLSSLQYGVISSDHKNGTGAQAGLGYNFYFAPNWSVRTGVGLGFFNAKTTLGSTDTYKTVENQSHSYITSTINGNGDLRFTYEYTGYEEKPSATLLTIPVMLQFETIGSKAFYFAVGGKIGIPLSAQYKTSGQLKTTGYNLELEVPINDNLPDYGFGTYDVNHTTDWDLNLSVQLSVEAGVKWHLTDKLNLYSGVYFDYGLNDLNKNNNDDPTAFRLINYQPKTPGEFIYGGIFNGSDKLYPVALGITVRLSFGLGSL
ncbi:MAG: PorT family protein [Prevotellaceae bacterium]|nr:PorT family protein [Prevotellaceae bacterium]